MNLRFGELVPRWCVAALLAAGLLAACQRAPDGSTWAGSLQRAHVQSMTVKISQVTDGQRSWLELIFGTIGLSIGQTSPAVTIGVDPGFGS